MIKAKLLDKTKMAALLIDEEDDDKEVSEDDKCSPDAHTA